MTEATAAGGSAKIKLMVGGGIAALLAVLVIGFLIFSCLAIACRSQ
jgi:hypothetical protein